jgi:deoxyadenosine/deoxycytidine kinase
MPARFVAVAGNIGAGKSSLVKWLDRTFGFAAYYEPHEDNPYLVDFYRDMSRWAFSSQLFFLVHRFRMQRDLERSLETTTARGVVLDRSLYEDAEVFAAYLHEAKHIDDRDWATYRSLYEGLRSELVVPDLMIYLRCPVKTLRRRIRARGRGYEQAIPTKYLTALDRLYEAWFSTYTLSRTLVIDTSEVDYVEGLFDRRATIEAVERALV